MLEFFRGWKRKLGCVNLVMACLLAIGWVRSLIVMDYIDLPVGQHTFFVLATHPRFVAMFVEFDPIVESRHPLPVGKAKRLRSSLMRISRQRTSAQSIQSSCIGTILRS